MKKYLFGLLFTITSIAAYSQDMGAIGTYIRVKGGLKEDSAFKPPMRRPAAFLNDSVNMLFTNPTDTLPYYMRKGVAEYYRFLTTNDTNYIKTLAGGGATGPTGATGATGATGPTGATGSSANISVGTLDSLAPATNGATISNGRLLLQKTGMNIWGLINLNQANSWTQTQTFTSAIISSGMTAGASNSVGLFLNSAHIYNAIGDINGVSVNSDASGANRNVFSNVSGNVHAFSQQIVYNQTSGTAANTDIYSNAKQTAVGSGPQNVIDAQRDSISRFRVTSLGHIFTPYITTGATTDSGIVRTTGNEWRQIAPIATLLSGVNLQQVTNNGNTTTNSIESNNGTNTIHIEDGSIICYRNSDPDFAGGAIDIYGLYIQDKNGNDGYIRAPTNGYDEDESSDNPVDTIKWSGNIVTDLVAPIVVSSDNVQAQSGSAIVTYTTDNLGSYASYVVNISVNINAISAATLVTTITFRDQNATNRTITVFGQGTTTAALSTTGYNSLIPSFLQAYDNSNIEVDITVAGVSATYDYDVIITKVPHL